MRYLLMSRPLAARAARAAPLATQKLADRALPYDFEKREFVKAPIPTLDEVIAQESGATGRGHRVPRW